MIALEPWGSEEHYWRAVNDGLRSRRQMAMASGPYESTIPPKIAEIELSFPAAVAADLAEAEAALASFNSFAAATLAPRSPGGPFAAIMLWTEATSSSRIENLTVGAKQLALAQIDQATSRNAGLVWHNVRAMQRALAWQGPLTLEAILQIHAGLMDGTPIAGSLRQELVWVGTSAVTPRGAAHVAPQPQLVRPALEDLLVFMERRDFPAIAQVAIAHAQFEGIHPFADGNGRTGRTLVQLFLQQCGILDIVAPISAGILTDTEAYFKALDAYRDGDAGKIISVFVSAALAASEWGRRLVKTLVDWRDDVLQRLEAEKAPASSRDLLPHFLTYPAMTSAFAKKIGLGSSASIDRALRDLVERGLLKEISGKARGRVYLQPDVIAMVDGFAPSLRRK